MWQYALKVALSAVVVVALAELAKRSTFWGALLASLSLVSLLAFVWLYLDMGTTERVGALSQGIFWLVLASLALFLVLPALLRMGWPSWPSLGASCALTVGAYFALIWALGRLGIRI